MQNFGRKNYDLARSELDLVAFGGELDLVWGDFNPVGSERDLVGGDFDLVKATSIKLRATSI